MSQSSAIEQQIVPVTRSRTSSVLIVIAASVIIALSAKVAVPLPFSGVPITLQPLALLLVGSMLGWKRGFAAASLYLLEGAAGLPVFAPTTSTLPAFVGPTAGYLVLFPITCAIAGFAAAKFGTSRLLTFAGMCGAIAALYLGGWAWLAYGLHLGASTSFAVGVVPYIAADLCKAALAAALVAGRRRPLKPLAA